MTKKQAAWKGAKVALYGATLTSFLFGPFAPIAMGISMVPAFASGALLGVIARALGDRSRASRLVVLLGVALPIVYAMAFFTALPVASLYAYGARAGEAAMWGVLISLTAIPSAVGGVIMLERAIRPAAEADAAVRALQAYADLPEVRAAVESIRTRGQLSMVSSPETRGLLSPPEGGTHPRGRLSVAPR